MFLSVVAHISLALFVARDCPLQLLPIAHFEVVARGGTVPVKSEVYLCPSLLRRPCGRTVPSCTSSTGFLQDTW